ncbi:MAG TPA: TylF/MycF/NovP-related O-methyltransferase [Candidatus Acidoferrum sp.]|nr:TylF/MycF/NovP-related O-methyltransferase [Candidatus Acidoferrum sp.]
MAISRWQKVRDGIGFRLLQLGYSLRRVRGVYPVIKPFDPAHLDILADQAFQESVREVAELTMLDTPRLANLWQLCRLTDPSGNILEIGSYKGGGALHLSNCSPDRKVIICDSFRGFEAVDSTLDTNFNSEMFTNYSAESIAALFNSRRRKHEIINGFFPVSAAGKTIAPVSFVHLDADVYKSTIESLNYLQQSRVLLEKSIVVLDDFGREAGGVVQAAAEFTSACPNWKCFPMFPGQALLLPSSWFVGKAP